MEQELRFNYHRESDELNIHVGEPRPALSRSLGDEVYVRVDRVTGEVVGFTILHFRARFNRRRSPDLSFVLPVIGRFKLPKKLAA